MNAVSSLSLVVSSAIPQKITLDDYAKSVDQLAALANTQCGTSKIAAQIVLGLYNGNNWHTNLTQLRNLDAKHYRAAMIAIRGRMEFNLEPHEIIDDGDAVFDRLQDTWAQYHVKNRYKNF